MNAIWPLLLFLIKPVWEYLQKFLGWEKNEAVAVKSCGASVTSECSCCPKTENGASGSSDEVVFDFPESPFDLDESMSWDFMIQSKTPVVAKFTASWCKPCKAIAPTLNALAETYRGKVHFVNVDVDAFEGIQSRYKVLGSPLWWL